MGLLSGAMIVAAVLMAGALYSTTNNWLLRLLGGVGIGVLLLTGLDLRYG